MAMELFQKLLANNQRWAAEKVADDPDFFRQLSTVQEPEVLWIGCSDSRVPANQITGLQPGEVFVHRNIANVVPREDVNSSSVIQYAVTALKVRHIIVCGHYGCGGVQAALGGHLAEPLELWVQHIREIRQQFAGELDAFDDDDARWRRLCELNVLTQVQSVASLSIVRDAWKQGQPLAVHGWIYDLCDGLLRDLGASVAGAT